MKISYLFVMDMYTKRKQNPLRLIDLTRDRLYNLIRRNDNVAKYLCKITKKLTSKHKIKGLYGKKH